MADDKNDDTPGRDTESKSNPAEERSRYFKKLEEWLQEAYAWQSVAAMFPYYMMSGQSVTNPTFGTKETQIFILQGVNKCLYFDIRNFYLHKNIKINVHIKISTHTKYN